MAKSQFLQSSFASGELSPLILGRTDIDQYYKGGQKVENVVIVPQGGIKRRPGTKRIEEILPTLLTPLTYLAPTMAKGGTVANIYDGDDTTFGITASTFDGTPYQEFARYEHTQIPTAKYIDVKDISITSLNDIDRTATVILQDSSDGLIWRELHSFTISSAYQTSKRFNLDKENIDPRFQYRLVTNLLSVAGSDLQIKTNEFVLRLEDGPVGNVKTFDFSYATDEHYLGVLTSGNLRFYRTPHEGSTETLWVTDIIVPYGDADIKAVRDAQTENVMLMFHEDYAPLRIILNLNGEFTSGPVPFSNVPQYDYNDEDSPTPVSAVQVLAFPANIAKGTTYQIDIEGVLSKNITYAGDDGGLQSESTAFNMQKNLQEMPIFGDTGISVTRTGAGQFTITISDESAKPLLLFSAFATSGTNTSDFTFTRSSVGVSRKEDVWSAIRGYPLMGAFSEGRLWFGGTKSKRQSLLASKSGDLFNFFSEEGADDDGIFITINSRNLTEITDVNPDRGLQVFCSGGEFIVKGNTPSTVTIEAETQLGSYGIETKSLDGSTLFINSNGNTLRQYLYNFNEDAYTSNDISVLSSHLINKPKDMSAVDGSSSEDSSWVFIINQDGTAAVLNTVRAQDINGFTKWQPYLDTVVPENNSILESCSNVGGELYVIASNNNFYDVLGSYPDQATVTIEKWDFDSKFDSCQTSTKSSPFVLNTIDVGLQFAGQTIGIIANGVVLDDRAVDLNGEITLDSTEMPQAIGELVTYTYGYNIPISFKSMPLNTNPGTRGGQNVMKEKKITRMNLRVLETSGVYVDGIQVAVRQFGYSNVSPLDTPLTPKSGIIEDNSGGNGWSTEVVPLITVPKATPFHLQAIQYEVESS
tara:strand:+ start:1334 stop:3940 length:2607 start_codon:yes stop_codon:yes gene_type:complete